MILNSDPLSAHTLHLCTCRRAHRVQRTMGARAPPPRHRQARKRTEKAMNTDHLYAQKKVSEVCCLVVSPQHQIVPLALTLSWQLCRNGPNDHPSPPPHPFPPQGTPKASILLIITAIALIFSSFCSICRFQASISCIFRQCCSCCFQLDFAQFFVNCAHFFGLLLNSSLPVVPGLALVQVFGHFTDYFGLFLYLLSILLISSAIPLIFSASSCIFRLQASISSFFWPCPHFGAFCLLSLFQASIFLIFLAFPHFSACCCICLHNICQTRTS
jgi:hypothetical protein